VKLLVDQKDAGGVVRAADSQVGAAAAAVVR
jgi:hypothetical protein